ncbi:universal stress protein [Serpentinicella alkaliphila]|uniref:Universal stress protein family protein n=1 Tax=Serpentinicella alkaliphila TaxID=1734049 RepID=A0A4R2TAI6_9FIRM|nr:universal stress protein [Serpentinicella alkaliphila]QUH25781.1 universal stress protein [Serpentinicella alkaliphila]TCP99780.1 universal stress protein family protein [Serpentinicella alkaliphila]
MGENNIMVCVTQQRTCERLIKAGLELSSENSKLYVVHVAPKGLNILGNSEEGEALDYLFDISKNVGADMTVIRSSETSKSIIDFCKKNDVNIIVFGESRENVKGNNIIVDVSKKLCNKVEIKVIPTN